MALLSSLRKSNRWIQAPDIFQKAETGQSRDLQCRWQYLEEPFTSQWPVVGNSKESAIELWHNTKCSSLKAVFQFIDTRLIQNFPATHNLRSFWRSQSKRAVIRVFFQAKRRISHGVTHPQMSFALKRTGVHDLSSEEFLADLKTFIANNSHGFREMPNAQQSHLSNVSWTIHYDEEWELAISELEIALLCDGR